MGLFRNWPYANMNELNIDWVLEVCHRAEENIKNINTQIETVVRPMIDEQKQFIIAYYNTLRTYTNGKVNYVIAENQKLQANVNKQLYANSLEIGKLRSYVYTSLLDTQNNLETQMSVLRRDTRDLITHWNGVFESMSATQQAYIKKAIRDFTIEYNKQLAENSAKMRELEQYVRVNVKQVYDELDLATTRLNAQMESMELHLQEQMVDTIDTLTDMGHAIVAEVRKQSADVDAYYKRISSLIENMFSLQQAQIDQKADIVYVDAQIEEIRKLIEHVNREITVINPVTEELDSLQNTLYSLYNSNNYWHLTAKEYDNLDMRAEDYDDISTSYMDAFEYDEAGKWYLKIYSKLYTNFKQYVDNSVDNLRAWTKDNMDNLNARVDKNYKEFKECCNGVKRLLKNELFMDSPFTGYTVPLKNVILKMLDMLNTDGIRADAYDSIGLTVDTYDGYNLTAYDYDWKAGTLIT